MSFLARLLGREPRGRGDDDLDKRLQKLEAEAETAAPAYVGTAYNRAGDVALRGGDSQRAVGYYGRAIDAFLSDGQREAARGVANKIIRVRPGAVRTLCTLTWLDLAARHSATALLHLRDYVEAAKGIERTGIAASQIYEMARLVPDTEFIAAVADALEVLDYGYLGEEVRDWVKEGGSTAAVADPLELAEACLLAAVKSNERGERAEREPVDDAEDGADGDEAVETSASHDAGGTEPADDADTGESPDASRSGDPDSTDEAKDAEIGFRRRGKKRKKGKKGRR